MLGSLAASVFGFMGGSAAAPAADSAGGRVRGGGGGAVAASRTRPYALAASGVSGLAGADDHDAPSASAVQEGVSLRSRFVSPAGAASAAASTTPVESDVVIMVENTRDADPPLGPPQRRDVRSRWGASAAIGNSGGHAAPKVPRLDLRAVL